MLDALLSALALGFDVQNLVAGLMGGVSASFAFDKDDPWDIVGTVVVGGLFGNYVAVPIGSIFDNFTRLGTSHGTAAFFVGVIAMPLCKLWVTSFKRQTR